MSIWANSEIYLRVGRLVGGIMIAGHEVLLTLRLVLSKPFLSSFVSRAAAAIFQKAIAAVPMVPRLLNQG